MEVIFTYNNFRLGTAGRDAGNKLSTNPGPGNYDNQTLFNKKKGYQFAHDKRCKDDLSGTPGPGQYYLPCSVVDVPRYLGGTFEEKFKWV
jgi:hypothetical protein